MCWSINIWMILAVEFVNSRVGWIRTVSTEITWTIYLVCCCSGLDIFCETILAVVQKNARMFGESYIFGNDKDAPHLQNVGRVNHIQLLKIGFQWMRYLSVQLDHQRSHITAVAVSRYTHWTCWFKHRSDVISVESCDEAELTIHHEWLIRSRLHILKWIEIDVVFHTFNAPYTLGNLISDMDRKVRKQQTNLTRTGKYGKFEGPKKY